MPLPEWRKQQGCHEPVPLWDAEHVLDFEHLRLEDQLIFEVQFTRGYNVPAR